MGVIFDVFRVIRRGAGPRGVVGTALDVLYWVAVAPPLAGLLWKANNGELRFYVVLGIAIGSLVYNAVASLWVVEALSAIWHGVARTLRWIVHGLVSVVSWPVIVFRRIGLFIGRPRLRRAGRPLLRGWRPAPAWRRR